MSTGLTLPCQAHIALSSHKSRDAVARVHGPSVTSERADIAHVQFGLSTRRGRMGRSCAFIVQLLLNASLKVVDGALVLIGGARYKPPFGFSPVLQRARLVPRAVPTDRTRCHFIDPRRGQDFITSARHHHSNELFLSMGETTPHVTIGDPDHPAMILRHVTQRARLQRLPIRHGRAPIDYWSDARTKVTRSSVRFTRLAFQPASRMARANADPS